MYGRTDLQKYQSACKLLKNFQIQPQGGASSRSGTRYVADQVDSTKKGRVVPFIFSDEQAYILLFEQSRLRFFLDPWNNPYWVRHVCKRGREHVYIYSFGPNRMRDSTKEALFEDDIGVAFKP